MVYAVGRIRYADVKSTTHQAFGMVPVVHTEGASSSTHMAVVL